MEHLKEFLRFCRHVYQNFMADGCRQHAGSLTYMTLFAIVPLMTVTYTMLSLIPTFQDVGGNIQTFLFDNLMPSASEQITGYLHEFSQQARKLTVVGVVFLAVTAYLMLKNIETTFNAIWHTHSNRKGLSSFLLYWAILSLGPLFIGLGFMISTYLLSIAVLVEEVDSTGIGRELLGLAPLLLQALTFTLIFAAVPNTRVPMKHAAIGGLLTAITFESAKKLFTVIVANTSYDFIYGAFAAVPLFLLWVYLCWMIILAGAEFVHSLSSYEPRNSRDHHPLIVAVGLLDLFYQRHKVGKTVSDRDIQSTPWLLGKQSLPARRWQSLRNTLLENSIIRVTDDGKYILGQDLHQLSLWQLANTIPGAWHPMVVSEFNKLDAGENTPAWYGNTRAILAALSRDNQNVMGESLVSLIEEPAAGNDPCATSSPA